jgi:DNA modification methylase
MHKARLQGSQSQWDTEESGRYADEPELFDRLVRCFFQHQDRFIADSAHCIFWLAAKNYWWTADLFRSNGWAVCETPLIWHKSDNAGIAPDVRRWPRRTYEIAIFASRGDRKITKVKSASVALPTTKEHHLSEKPLDMLTYFFEMVVDEHTTILDPTCGGGTALRAARALGASSGLGMDVMEEHVLYTNGRLA